MLATGKTRSSGLLEGWTKVPTRIIFIIWLINNWNKLKCKKKKFYCRTKWFSYTCIYIFYMFSIIAYHRILNTVPCACRSLFLLRCLHLLTPSLPHTASKGGWVLQYDEWERQTWMWIPKLDLQLCDLGVLSIWLPCTAKYTLSYLFFTLPKKKVL